MYMFLIGVEDWALERHQLDAQANFAGLASLGFANLLLEENWFISWGLPVYGTLYSAQYVLYSV